MPFHERIPPRMKDALRKALQKSPDEVASATGAAVLRRVLGGRRRTQRRSRHWGSLTWARPRSPRRVNTRQGRTEVGTPLEYGGAGAVSGGGYGPPPQIGTPAQGNVAFPTPNAGIPLAPSRTRGKRANRAETSRCSLESASAVIGVLSVGAIGLALHGRSSGGAPIDTTFDAGAPMPTVALLTGMDAGPPPPRCRTPGAGSILSEHSSLVASGGLTPHPVHSGLPGKEPPGREPPGQGTAGERAPRQKERHRARSPLRRRRKESPRASPQPWPSCARERA